MIIGVIVLVVFEVLRNQEVVELHGIVPTLVCAALAMVVGSWWDRRQEGLVAPAPAATGERVAVPTP